MANDSQTMERATVTHHRSWATAWNLGDALWWREPDGSVHAFLMTEEPEFGPRGGRKAPGRMTSIDGGTLDDVNAALHELGFESTDLTYDEIKVTYYPQPKPKPKPKPAPKRRSFSLDQIGAAHNKAAAKKR